ncbi:alanine--glyoxylate aminotransferase family protein [Alicyclobacillaceae bacterium I2511]|nr:alanine--glyoxylate aminotransferase family protein [Alicyclobacillaceae bacterium I2511]
MPNKELLLIPGPTPVVDEIYEALASETLAHTDPRFVSIFKESLLRTQSLFNTDGEVYVFAGSGTLAMEMAIVNTISPGEKLLVISHGYFGDRFVPLAKAYGIQVETIQAPWGQHADLEQVRQALAREKFKAVTVTHVDTSTGVMADLDALVPLVKESGALFLLDGVCASAAIEEDMQKAYGQPDYKIDIVLTASQKAIGVPPGLGIVAFGRQALAARAERKQVPAYFLDIANWRPIMDNPGRYFATPPVNMVDAYHQGLELVFKEGLQSRYQRHQALGKAVRAALHTYGMQALAEESIAAPTLSCVRYPEGVKDGDFRQALAQKGIIVAGALADLAGKAFRIGHMGNVTDADFIKAIRLIGETLQELGHSVNPQAAMDTFVEVYTQSLV